MRTTTQTLIAAVLTPKNVYAIREEVSGLYFAGSNADGTYRTVPDVASAFWARSRSTATKVRRYLQAETTTVLAVVTVAR